ncbi:MAG: 2OG-Fe(II) oxygenase [Gammaproteobacteria bacterium]|nr:2OG-Fe(II) oxygenase [Gammaproteobacteria bacterium]
MLKSFLQIFSKPEIPVPEEKRPTLINRKAGLIPDYTPDPIDECFCGSEKYFKNCCGSREEKREEPYGVLIVPEFIDCETLKAICDFADQQKGEPLQVIDEEKSTPGNIVKKVDKRRVSELVQLKQFDKLINDKVREAYLKYAPAFFKTDIEWYERPHLMRYQAGGYYQGHADSENINPELNAWEKVIDRDVSLLLYLNDAYEGGELFFNKFNYRLKPKAGMLVMFPSDHRYMHTAETVYEGIRYAVVSWASAKGMEKVSAHPPDSKILL